MSDRYRHWIEPAREGQWPSVIVCLDCQSELDGLRSHPVGMTERFESASVVILKGAGGVYRASAEYTITNVNALLAEIAAASRHYPNLWVMTFQASRIWSLLDIWRRVEERDIRIADVDYRSSAAYAQRLTDYRKQQADPLRQLGGDEERRLSPHDQGYLVTEDPPNILKCRLAPNAHAVTWVDARNYGIETIPDVMPGMETARWLARWTARVCELCKEVRLTALKPTVGSQAMAAWRHAYLTESVHVHTDGAATDLESAAYFGGRCEARFIGVVSTPSRHVDFRSQYGWVCANVPLPTRLLRYYQRPVDATSVVRDRAAECIADVTIETDEPAYPVRRDGEVIYPVGRYRTALCGPELVDAQARNRIREAHAVAVYEMGYPLRDYANRLYSLRCQVEQEDTPGVASWVKRLIVSLPGKLGQKQHRWIDTPDVPAQKPYWHWYEPGEGDELIRYRSIAGLVQRDCCEGYAASSVPAIAGFVTSHGRTRLLGAIRCAGWESIYYYDTDSLILSEDGYKRLARSEYMSLRAMGYLELRGSPALLEIRGVKYYIADRKVTCSGLARGHIVDLGDGHNYARYLSPAEQARQGRRPESEVRHETYPRFVAYNQGIVGPDGRVTPIRLWE